MFSRNRASRTVTMGRTSNTLKLNFSGKSCVVGVFIVGYTCLTGWLRFRSEE